MSDILRTIAGSPTIVAQACGSEYGRAGPARPSDHQPPTCFAISTAQPPIHPNLFLLFKYTSTQYRSIEAVPQLCLVSPVSTWSVVIIAARRLHDTTSENRFLTSQFLNSPSSLHTVSAPSNLFTIRFLKSPPPHPQRRSLHRNIDSATLRIFTRLHPRKSRYVPIMATMPRMTGIKAGRLPPSTLPHVPLASLCMDFVNGFCRRGEKCSKSHEICIVPIETTLAPRLNTQNNFLSLDPRATPPNKCLFDDDGPGTLSRYGPRHDNDHVEIKDISILPTTDEILCRRLPYMPRKDPYTAHRHWCGEERLLDTHFRHLRYENTEPIIDACYDASQHLFRLVSEPKVLDYDDRMVTARGFRYSLFRDVAFEEISFNAQKGVSLRVSFACPKGLRGSRLETTKHLEEGMLVALIGIDERSALSTIFMEIWQRQSTNAMRPRTGNDLRGEFYPDPY